MASEEYGLVKDWVRQGQMTYGQIHSLPHLLGQWQDTKVFDPQSPVGAGPMLPGQWWKCRLACPAQYLCFLLSCTQTLPNKPNNPLAYYSPLF